MISAECVACGQRFTPKRSTAKFCSARCRLTAHRSQNTPQDDVGRRPVRSLAFQAPR